MVYGKGDSFMDYFDCYLKIVDVNPQLVNAYKKYDDKHVSTGKCENARLHVVVEPCTDSNAVNCKETATLISSKGNTIDFPYNITPMTVSSFFGIK